MEKRDNVLFLEVLHINDADERPLRQYISNEQEKIRRRRASIDKTYEAKYAKEFSQQVHFCPCSLLDLKLYYITHIMRRNTF